jgi:hypothetical protein
MASTTRPKKSTTTKAAAPAHSAGPRDQLDRDLLALLQANARASTADRRASWARRAPRCWHAYRAWSAKA